MMIGLKQAIRQWQEIEFYITMAEFKIFIKDFIWWYKKQAPKYGYFRSIFDCWFNARVYTRDGKYKK